jgi:hypothetical protein
MGFMEVSSLDADVTIAIGKINKQTGKPYPTCASGYYLGKRNIESNRGDSKLHFLQTSEGNLGVWGTTDLNRKLSSVTPGTMVRITSKGTKPTPNGDMYIYFVESDKNNTIVVASEESNPESTVESVYNDSNDDSYNTDALQAARQTEVEQLFKKSSRKK